MPNRTQLMRNSEKAAGEAASSAQDAVYQSAPAAKRGRPHQIAKLTNRLFRENNDSGTPLNRFAKNLVCASRPDEPGTRNSADHLDRRFDLGQRFG